MKVYILGVSYIHFMVTNQFFLDGYREYLLNAQVTRSVESIILVCTPLKSPSNSDVDIGGADQT
jgi:hypothetical protein